MGEKDGAFMATKCNSDSDDTYSSSDKENDGGEM